MAQARRALSHRGLWLVGAGLALASLGVPGCGTDAGEPPEPMWTSGTGGQGGSGSPGGGRPSAGSKAITPEGGTSDGGDAGAGAYGGQSDAGENGGGFGGAAGSGGTGGAGMGGTAGMSGGGTGGMSGAAGMSGSSGTSGAGGVSGAGGTGGMSGAAGMSGSAGTNAGGAAGTGGTVGTGGGGASSTGGTVGTGGGGASNTGGGGASTGGGGADTGGGGASTGGGGSGPGYVCGDGMEEGDECETTNTPLCTDDCKKIATEQCVTCESEKPCFEFSDNCNFNNDTGESRTPAEREACYDVASCIRDTQCGNGAKTFTACFCGALDTTPCSAAPISGPGAPAGVCAPIIRSAMAGPGENAATLTNKQILERFLKSEYPAGAAIARWNCDKVNCLTECDLD